MLRLLASALILLWIGACGSSLSQADLDAIGELPLAERSQRLEGLVAEHPDNPQLPGLLARARWEALADYAPEDRILLVKQQLREDPENAVTSKVLGDAFYDHALGGGGISYLDSAIFAYENAALKAPHFLSAVGSVGALYDEKEDFEQAIYWYDRALAIDPEHVPTICNLGASYYNKGDYQAATDLYRQALAIDPDSQDAHYNLGVAFAEATIYKEAIAEWLMVVAIDPESSVGKQAKKNADLLQEVLDETVYKGGRKSRRLDSPTGN
jgi:tetratricopeptide (TPR) repeat protein